MAAKDLPYAGVESLRVWLPGTCRMQEWGVSEFDCQGPAVTESSCRIMSAGTCRIRRKRCQVAKNGVKLKIMSAADHVYRSGESQSLAARDLPYAGVESLRVWLPGTCRMQEWSVSEFGCQGPAVYRSGESQSLAARDLPYAGVESLRVWLPGTCRMSGVESLRSLAARDLPYAGVEISEFGCQGPAVCRSGVSEFGCQGPAVCRSGESQSLAARDLPKRCQVANNERWDLPYTAKTVSSCK